MKIFGWVLTIIGIISLIYLTIIFPGQNQVGFIIGYFTIPTIILVIGLFLVFKDGIKFKGKEQGPKELPYSQEMLLNTPQRILLTVSAMLIALMVIFPPTYYYAYDNLKGKTFVFSGYRFISGLETNTQATQVPSLMNKEERVFASIYHIEPYRLSFQIFGILLITGLLLAVFHQRSNYKPS